MKLVLGALTACLFLTQFTAAQEEPRVQVFGGYSFVDWHYHFVSNTALSQPPATHLNGWDSSATFNLTRILAVEGEVGGTYQSQFLGTTTGLSIYTFMAGPRISTPGKGKLFAHALFGESRISFNGSDNAFAMALGGGTDIWVEPRFGIRVFELDYLRTSNNVGRSPQNALKAATGVLFRF